MKNQLDFLQLKLENQDVICGNISILNKEKTEAVVTTIKSNAKEHHILTIMEMLQKYNVNLKHIYCFCKYHKFICIFLSEINV